MKKYILTLGLILLTFGTSFTIGHNDYMSYHELYSINKIIEVLYSQDYVTLKIDGYHEYVNIELYNMIGQKIMVDNLVIKETGYKIKRRNQYCVVRIFNHEIDRCIKIY